ncbi:MAG: hypothetical protein EAZ37_11300 [Burkholderiales bacterium]|nr:MAG: hypothetical protein EAZ37_11300 [Burkholderiales bacterium]
MIGGMAVGLHGFVRATKDIDLLLPVNAHNNRLLMTALEQLVGSSSPALQQLRLDWMDKGHSTALEDRLAIDLLYVAADQSFEQLQQHIIRVSVGDAQISVLNVDGLIKTKLTSRDSDTADRIKLERLRNALQKKPNL